MDKPWTVILSFVGVFVAGAVFGGLFTLRFERPVAPAPIAVQETKPAVTQPVVTTPPAAGASAPGAQAGTTTAAAPAPAQPRGIAPALMRQFTQRLSPTPDQTRKIRLFVSRASDDLQRLQREHLQDTTRVTERMYEDVAAILSPEQRTQLEKMRQEMLERVRKEREKRGEIQAKAAPANSARRPNAPEGSNPPAKD
jgi:hypothetical protein